MSHFPNQHAKNMSRPNRWTMQRCHDEWRQAQDRARNAKAQRIDNALMVAGGLLAVAALILAIMGA